MRAAHDECCGECAEIERPADADFWSQRQSGARCVTYGSRWGRAPFRRGVNVLLGLLYAPSDNPIPQRSHRLAPPTRCLKVGDISRGGRGSMPISPFLGRDSDPGPSKVTWQVTSGASPS
jgi:hypothetical protein